MNGNRPDAWYCEAEGIKGDRSHFTLQLGTPDAPEGWLLEMQTCIPSDPDEQECVNNSLNLITAAPDLLKSLNDLMNSIGGGMKHCGHTFSCVCAWDQAKSAISKATGEQK